MHLVLPNVKSRIRTAFIPLCALIASSFASLSATAAPWVDVSDVYLRANIQHLADEGFITTPVNTFPLMWIDIEKDIKKINVSQLNDAQRNAYYNIRHQLGLAKKNKTIVKFNVATDDPRFTSFGDKARSNSISIQTEYATDSFAVALTPSVNRTGDKESNYDGSYIAGIWGNWVVSLGKQDRWWGPGWDTNLSLTNNARPLPALALSRHSSLPFTVPFTEHDIPWTMTTFMGIMDDNRIVKNTLLWGFRANFKLTDNLELGISRLAQWAGKGRIHDAKTFLRVLAGQDNCGGTGPTIEECANGEEPGNQMAGYDLRWSSSLFEQPLSVYFTLFAEDGDRKGGLSIFGEERYQLGVDTRLNLFSQNWRVYLEATDTYTICSDGVNGDGTSRIGDCYYEHSTYSTGMRYRGNTIASLYENDSSTLVLGAISQISNSESFEFKFRWLQLNKDNHDKAPNNNIVGNTLTPIAENMLMLSGKYQGGYNNWRYTIGASVSESQFDNDIDDEHDIDVSINLEYKL